MRELIREMNEDELQMVMGWAENEGWNPGKHDYKPYYALDKQGFLLLLIDEKPVGSISIVKYSPTFAFIGLFIINPEYRNKGYGKKLWQYAMDQLAQHTSVGLYAMPQQISRYSQSGFSKGHMNNRWCMPDSKAEFVTDFLDEKQSSVTMYNKLVDYDCSLWGSSRKDFFDSLLQQPQVFAFITFDRDSGEVNGYGVVRPCTKGFRIGPFYSNTPENAKILTHILISKLPNGSQIIFDIPDKNKFSQLFSEYFHLTKIDNLDTQAMFKGEIHNGSEEKCYGVASLEIG